VVLGNETDMSGTLPFICYEAVEEDGVGCPVAIVEIAIHFSQFCITFLV
jgi:hypothetical protein